MRPVISARGLIYCYPDGTPALRGVDFDLHEGETVVLFGPNGSGKTTFLHHLNGLIRGEGRLTVCNIDAEARNLARLREKVGLLFQDPDDQLFLPTVLEDVCFGPLNMGAEPAAAIEIAREMLELTGAAHVRSRAPQHLSAGEKRRVALAGVLAMRPAVLALDEPTTWLDPPAQRSLVSLLRTLPQAKVVATHDVPFARAVATRAVFFDSGRIVAAGEVDALVERFEWLP
ncbi:MAG TPA: ABC transporter ATP-binding protein [Bryobacteraceae bacterium]|nr:ABC transporter ATP-binding protein [Bryobacteraceae bacterium]